MKNPRTPSASLLWLIACAFIFTQFFTQSQDESCGSVSHQSHIDFVNNVILEFEKYGFDCAGNLSRSAGCLKAALVNGTRVVVNGKVAKKIVAPAENVLETKKEEIRQKPRGPKLLFDRITSIARGPAFALLDCADIVRLFTRSEDKENTFAGISEVYGTLDHPVIGRTPAVLKKAKLHGDAFRILDYERRKRRIFGTGTRISGRMLAECQGLDEIQVVVENIQTVTTLCDKMDGKKSWSYTETNCYNNKKLMNLIEKSENRIKSTFFFIKELLCMFAEIESKKFFVRDIHGKHIGLTSDFSVLYEDVGILSHHGSRNVLSGGACKYDENCPTPEGELWSNQSANHAVYSKCLDTNPYCHDTSCSGYNASLHICGISRWLLQPLYKYFTRIQDRSRITSVLMSTMNSWPFLRSSAMESCKKVMVYYDLFEKDMKDGNKAKSRSFHVG